MARSQEPMPVFVKLGALYVRADSVISAFMYIPTTAKVIYRTSHTTSQETSVGDVSSEQLAEFIKKVEEVCRHAARDYNAYR